MNPKDFYDLAKHPTPELLADYPWLEGPAEGRIARGLPLAGHVPGPARHDGRGADPGHARRLPRGDRRPDDGARGPRNLTFYEILTLASMVEREAVARRGAADDRRRLREPARPSSARTAILGSDPTVFYVNDTLELAKLAVRPVEDVRLLDGAGRAAAGRSLPPELAGLPDLHPARACIPGPIATPTIASIDAALAPDTKDGYLYFLAKNDGSDNTPSRRPHASTRRT